MKKNQIVESLSKSISRSLLTPPLAVQRKNNPLFKIVNEWLTDLSRPSYYEKFRHIETLRNRIRQRGSTEVFSDRSESEIDWIIEANSWGCSWQWLSLFHNIIEKMQMRNGIEIGTCLGFSSAYMAMALPKNSPAELHTFEINPILCSTANRVLKQLNLENVNVRNQYRLHEIKKTIRSLQSVDFVFIDGDHEKQDTLSLFQIMLEHASPNAIIAFDDIRWSMGMREVWQTVRKHPRVSTSLDLHRLGLCQLNGPQKRRQQAYLPLFLH